MLLICVYGEPVQASIPATIKLTHGAWPQPIHHQSFAKRRRRAREAPLTHWLVLLSAGLCTSSARI